MNPEKLQKILTRLKQIKRIKIIQTIRMMILLKTKTKIQKKIPRKTNKKITENTIFKVFSVFYYSTRRLNTNSYPSSP